MTQKVAKLLSGRRALLWCCAIVQCFQCANYFRVVLTVPEDKLREASQRIAEFCSRHYSPPPLSNGHV